ncbi:myosin head (motor domain) domain-containing protein [Ditylenchus destructor]|nr:myosin head (motor domain) domain-containing protein [Ditylenchus destructor]
MDYKRQIKTFDMSDHRTKLQTLKHRIKNMNFAIKKHPDMEKTMDDMANLTCLDEESVLQNLKERFFNDKIYTYSGLFCVVINPYKALAIYSHEVITDYKGKKRQDCAPHIFAVTDDAYRSMLQEKKDQSILCTGESGAGKTENTKKIIQYLVHVAGVKRANTLASPIKGWSPSKFSSSNKNHPRRPTTLINTGDLELLLLLANPILEAFGNSKTVKNDNSSRFGKFIRIYFDAAGYIAGANIEVYLLEKSRTCRQAIGERNFHVFYQLLRGADNEQRVKYMLEDLNKYAYLTNGNMSVPNVDDIEEFQNTLSSLQLMLFAEDEIDFILRLLSAILLLGNIKFASQRSSDGAFLMDDSVAQKVCHLLGLSLSDFTKAFLRPKVKIGREEVQKTQTKEQVEFVVEAVSKSCYERMFKWLVNRLNISLGRSPNSAINNSFIGILDIAGFEIFELNSFEQFCINYTNEKLQQLFNNTMFILEQEEYKREEITWDYIDFGLDLQPTIDLIEKPMGILSLLDEQCLFPKATDKSFAEKLIVNHKKHSKFVMPEMRDRSDFAVVHYAGRVDYSVDKWLIKNMDPINDSVVSLMQSSNNPFVALIWKDETSSTGSTELRSSNTRMSFRKGVFRTVGQLHKENLTRLMATLHKTSPHFVRCIVPNHEKMAGKIDSELVLDQLRCNGVLEGIRIARQGYPSRLTFQDFRRRYAILTPDIVPAGFVDGRIIAKKMIDALEIASNLYQIGQTKMFFRAGVLAILEEEREKTMMSLIVRCQAYFRGYLARKKYRALVKQSNAVKIVQRNGLVYTKLRNWLWWKLFTQVRPLLQIANQEERLMKRNEEIRHMQDRLESQDAELLELRDMVEKLMVEKCELQAQLSSETEDKNLIQDRLNQFVGYIEKGLQVYAGVSDSDSM